MKNWIKYFPFGTLGSCVPNSQRQFIFVLGHRAHLWLLLLQTEVGQSWEPQINVTSDFLLKALGTTSLMDDELGLAAYKSLFSVHG